MGNQSLEDDNRVQNDTVLQVCVDQQWTTVENTSQLCSQLSCHAATVHNPLNPQCPTVFPATISTTKQQPNNGFTTYTVGIVVLAILLLLTAAGWVVTCVVVWRKRNNKLR